MKIDNTVIYGLAGLLIGYMIAKRTAASAVKAPAAPNEVTWWSYAGSWAA